MEPTQGLERILLVGGYGSGKSTAWCNVAEWSHKRDGGKLFVLDTDMAAERMKVGHKAAFDSKVVIHDLFEWDDYNTAIKEVRGKAAPNKNDWLVVDLVDKAWEAVQAYYVDQVFSKSIDSYFLEARKRSNAGNPLDGWVDWQYINKLYLAWMMKVLRFPGHVLCCAPADQLITEGKNIDPEELRNTFGRFGIKPKGQKALGYQFHTILYLQQGKGDTWVMNTIKDREREVMKKVQHTDFFINYLKGVAGWTL